WTKDQVKSFLEALDEIHLSFDVDSMDPSLCPGVSTPVGGGLTPDQALDLVELGFDSVHVSSMDIVEFNPVHDQGKTVELILRMDAMVQSKLNGECA
ncbi:MAG: arginase family protein, partial [Erysipelotrichaceae bacterium]|nr:arginase family protein [Erysipelotrichaceae bacterium]